MALSAGFTARDDGRRPSSWGSWPEPMASSCSWASSRCGSVRSWSSSAKPDRGLRNPDAGLSRVRTPAGHDLRELEQGLGLEEPPCPGRLFRLLVAPGDAV